MTSAESVPAAARVVVIGGGVGGASVAHHLAQAGERDVVLLERAELTSGSTFHSAGLVGQLRADPTLTRMNMYSVELYRQLQQGPQPPGWTESGSIKLASTPERMEEIRRQISWATVAGLPLVEISAVEAAAMFPLVDTTGVVGGCFLPSDGSLDPSQLCQALATRARAGGVRILTRTRVLGIDTACRRDERRVTRVRTDRGDVECEVVVDCGGMFAAQIARMVGVRVPVVPMSHQYLVTAPMPGSVPAPGSPPLPSLRDPDLLVYYRQEVDGLLMGGYERDPAPWTATARSFDDVPADFNGRLLPEDWDRFEEITTNAQIRVPAMADVPIRRLVNGPEAFTPDNEFCLGETEVAGFFVAAGFCAHGIAGAGGIGQVMAAWILDGDPGMDVWHMDVRRFGGAYRSPSYTLARTLENYRTYYDIAYPGRERTSGRPLRTSPAYPWHAAHGAVFGEKAGWERVNHYAANEDPALGHLRPDGWAARTWSTAVAVEHRATREAAGLFDESSFAKISVSGPDAVPFLERVCDNRVARDVGAVTYTQLLNPRGGIEADVTVTRTGEQEFLVVTGTAFGPHDLGWLRIQARPGSAAAAGRAGAGLGRHRAGLGTNGGGFGQHSAGEEGTGFDVRLRDVTGSLVTYALWGPRARDVLAPLTPADLSSSAFGFMTSQEITVADVPVRALRVTFVGEHGWELYAPVEYGAGLWAALFDAGGDVGLRACGYRAIESLRLEKGYRVWSSDITPETGPDEAGLGFCVKLAKPAGFVGDAAVRAAREAGPTRVLSCLVLADPRKVALGGEPVRVGGEPVARVTSAGFGHTLERSIAYAYLPSELASPGTAVQVDLFGEQVPGQVAATPLYDPSGSRLR